VLFSLLRSSSGTWDLCLQLRLILILVNLNFANIASLRSEQFRFFHHSTTIETLLRGFQVQASEGKYRLANSSMFPLWSAKHSSKCN
jgi:hypothetical protein